MKKFNIDHHTIAVFGSVGVGKSSTINSWFTILGGGDITQPCLVGTASGSYTKELTIFNDIGTFILHDYLYQWIMQYDFSNFMTEAVSASGATVAVPIKLCDLPGDISLASAERILDGNLPNLITLAGGASVSPSSTPGYRHRPTIRDQPHVVILVISADQVSNEANTA